MLLGFEVCWRCLGCVILRVSCGCHTGVLQIKPRKKPSKKIQVLTQGRNLFWNARLRAWSLEIFYGNYLPTQMCEFACHVGKTQQAHLYRVHKSSVTAACDFPRHLPGALSLTLQGRFWFLGTGGVVCGRAAPDPLPAGWRSENLRVGLLQVGATRGSERRLVFTPHEPWAVALWQLPWWHCQTPPDPKSSVCSHSVKGMAKWEHTPAKLDDLLWVKRKWK